MANVSISATFPTAGQAESAAAKLRALRADRVHLDKQSALEGSASLLVESSQELAVGEAVRLTADVHEGVQPQVLRVLEQCGGQRC